MEQAKSITSNRHEKTKSIAHALSILNDAAQESSDDIREMVNKDFKKVKSVISDFKPELRGALREIGEASSQSVIHLKERAVEQVKHAANQVDTSVHEKPWIYLGASAALAGVLGFALGRKLYK